MKKIVSLALASALAFGANASENQSYKLITVSTYLNFYLLNLNACEDYHPSTRSAAYAAEATLYPYFEKLEKKLSKMDINPKDKEAIANTVSSRREKLNMQIADDEFTVEHCNAVIGIVNDGLDSKILEAVN
ncbi:MAG: hypothetical protein HWE10_09365 [Gammaproteobacteria bacterium]|nr:hypothetical protein [Gammaproteobacteria bacterium]